jgi:hypothetical protein
MNNHFLKTATAVVSMVSLFASAQERIDLEAGQAKVNSPLIFAEDYLHRIDQTETGSGGRAVFIFTLTNAATYAVLARVQTAESARNSLLLNIDAEPEGPAMTWNIPLTKQFADRLVTWRGPSTTESTVVRQKVFSLSAGEHRLILRDLTPGVKLTRLSLLRVPAPPSSLHVAEHTSAEQNRPAPPSNLRVIRAEP